MFLSVSLAGSIVPVVWPAGSGPLHYFFLEELRMGRMAGRLHGPQLRPVCEALEILCCPCFYGESRDSLVGNCLRFLFLCVCVVLCGQLPIFEELPAQAMYKSS